MSERTSLGHWCAFCQCYHSSSSCFHPGHQAMASLENEIATLKNELAQTQASLQSEKNAHESWKQGAAGWEDKYLKAEAEIEWLQGGRRWIPVSERLPKDGEEVLISIDFSYVTAGKHYKRAHEWESLHGYYYHGNEYAEITHWMPLPEPPKEEK